MNMADSTEGRGVLINPVQIDKENLYQQQRQKRVEMWGRDSFIARTQFSGLPPAALFFNWGDAHPSHPPPRFTHPIILQNQCVKPTKQKPSAAILLVIIGAPCGYWVAAPAESWSETG
jgi:hypothetical protein